MEPITLDECLVELRRELRMRHQVYPNSRTMTHKVAARRIAIIEFLIDHIEAKLPQQQSLFAGSNVEEQI
jgi:hypothetical protein